MQGAKNKKQTNPNKVGQQSNSSNKSDEYKQQNKTLWVPSKTGKQLPRDARTHTVTEKSLNKCWFKHL